MSDEPHNTPEGWYADPWDPRQLRYWDGTTWTGHVHPTTVGGSTAGSSTQAAPTPSAVAGGASDDAPAGAAPIDRPPSRRRGRKAGLLIGGIAVVAVAAVVTALIIVPGVTGSNGRVYADRSTLYDFTDPRLGLPRDHVFEIDVDYDLESANAAHEAENPVPDPDRRPESGAPDWAIEVYYDAALTKPAQFLTFQSEPGGRVEVSGNESGRAYGGAGDRVIQELDRSTPFRWGLHDEYFLVQHLEKDGSPRAKPLVTRFTFDTPLATPDVVFGSGDEAGSLAMSWTPVEGATSYLVVTNEVGRGADGSQSVLAEVTDTRWSSAGQTESFQSKEATFVSRQNLGLEGFNYRALTQDQTDAGEQLDPEEAARVAQSLGSDIGVIATDGSRFSAYHPHDIEEVAGWMPLEVAMNADSALKNWGPSGYIEGIENVQKVLPVTSVDGRTRSTVAFLDEDAILDLGDRWVIALRGRNTLLGDWIPITKASTPDPRASIAQFNAAALAAAPPTGQPRFETFEIPEDSQLKPVSETPDLGYPVYGSTEFSRFIGAHLIAQTEWIDISAYVDQPGAPDPYDAFYEARYQNPYAFSPQAVRLRADGKAMRVTYLLPTDQVRPLQEQMKAKVDGVVAEVTNDGMSARDKVAALNEWLISNAEYDHPAFDAMQAMEPRSIPAGYESAWLATGTLLDGTGVCASYAAAFTALANAAGVETVVVGGDVLAGGPHAWNKVRVDEQWLAVDTTWNDGDDPTRYLMIRDAEFTDSATRTQSSYWMIDSAIPAYATP
ncbi:DUF2510 domain-containing protein [Microbacterium sp. RURRCA19A]|uniref:DUF2510 domain-containing protein n=1 Tax=Microbacterium sp. RURRCA19A TaxID=1907391 RepID=UPI000955877A|nr:DUF2510 domain-containing protein [Microbacterium sp. RURRCA19A]SIR48989.1 Protein of unknown function [Microbacterium sp. RURRCA19A]